MGPAESEPSWLPWQLGSVSRGSRPSDSHYEAAISKEVGFAASRRTSRDACAGLR